MWDNEDAKQGVQKIHHGRSYLSTPESIVTRQVEDILHKLWNCITANPEENSLSILDQEETMPF